MSTPFIHPSAEVGEQVELGEGVQIWHHAHVMDGARLGAGVLLGHAVFVGRGVRIGARCRIQNHANLFEGVELDDDVFVGPSATFTNVKNPRIGRRGTFLPTRVARGVTIGANATILPGLLLGESCFVAAGAVVTRDVAPFSLVQGAPARAVGFVSAAGERLDFGAGTEARCPESGELYRLEEGRVVRGSS
ncbi:MAG TPA: acyltransferase [Polyangiaceae bacterium]|nr:acyltransferase [Polyangiaceae bacterium]